MEGDLEGLDFVTGFPAEVAVNPGSEAAATEDAAGNRAGIRRLSASGASGRRH